jgi:hypothetical protein
MMYLTIQFTISILRLPSLNSHGALIIGLRHVLHIFFSIACQLVEDIIDATYTHSKTHVPQAFNTMLFLNVCWRSL